jgi:hypothetical protein
VIPDAEASMHKMVRVVNESGEDYLYPVEHFVPIDLQIAAESLFAE